MEAPLHRDGRHGDGLAACHGPPPLLAIPHRRRREGGCSDVAGRHGRAVAGRALVDGRRADRPVLQRGQAPRPPGVDRHGPWGLWGRWLSVALCSGPFQRSPAWRKRPSAKCGRRTCSELAASLEGRRSCWVCCSLARRWSERERRPVRSARCWRWGPRWRPSRSSATSSWSPRAHGCRRLCGDGLVASAKDPIGSAGSGQPAWQGRRLKAGRQSFACARTANSANCVGQGPAA